MRKKLNIMHGFQNSRWTIEFVTDAIWSVQFARMQGKTGMHVFNINQHSWSAYPAKNTLCQVRVCLIQIHTNPPYLVRKVGMPKPNKELSTSLPKQITAKILLTSNQSSKRSSHHHWLKYSGRSILFVLSLCILGKKN